MIEQSTKQHWAKELPIASELAGRSIESVEREFLKHEQVSCPVIHSFAPGLYMREVNLPAGSFVIGHHQNFDHMNIFLKGKVTMLNDDGSSVTLTAPMRFVGKPGRKIGYIHEDVVWMNVYSTQETDIEKLESIFLTKSETFQESIEAKNKIKMLKSEIDNSDFKNAIQEFGFSENTVRQQSENESDIIPLPSGSYKIKTAKSDIEGVGIFATANIDALEIIAPARLKGKRTIAGRFTNHSVDPNAIMIADIDENIHLMAKRNISGCHGGLDGEEITIDYRAAVELNLKLARGG